MTDERNTLLIEADVQKAVIAAGLDREKAAEDDIGKWKRHYQIERKAHEDATLELNQSRQDLHQQRHDCLALQDTISQMSGHTADRDVSAMSADLTQARRQVMAMSVGATRNSEDVRILYTIINYTINNLQVNIARTTGYDLNQLCKAIADLIRRVQSKLDIEMARNKP